MQIEIAYKFFTMEPKNPEIAINQRIASLIERFAGGKQKRFAEAIGISPSVISDLFGKRQNRPGLEMIQKIAAAYPTINVDWLVNGKGDMIKSDYFDTDLGRTKDDEILQTDNTQKALGLKLASIRQLVGLSVKEVAEACGCSVDDVIKLEEGETAITNLTATLLSALYIIPKRLLTTADEHELALLLMLSGAKSHIADSTAEVQALINSKPYRTNPDGVFIPMISSRVATSYPLHYLEPEFYKDIPSFSIPLPQLRNATFRAFQVSGASMVPTFYPGGWVIGRYQERKLESLELGSPYVVVTRDAVSVKRIVSIKNDGMVTLQSDNDEYQSYALLIDDILELWVVTADIGFQFPSQPTALNKKVTFLERLMLNVLDQANSNEGGLRYDELSVSLRITDEDLLNQNLSRILPDKTEKYTDQVHETPDPEIDNDAPSESHSSVKKPLLQKKGSKKEPK